MGHVHKLSDTDTRFSINPITRAIKNESNRKVKLVQFDHNSEVFTFEIPRYIEGHDMSLCNKVEVHYLNIDTKTNKKHKDFNELEDLHIDPEDENKVICSWTITKGSTQIGGILNFLLRYKCVEEGIETYAWNTDFFTGIIVAEGSDVAETFEETYVDIIEQWKASVMQYFQEDLDAWKEATAKAVREEAFEDITVQKERVDLLSNYVTPEMFGAVGDGVTDDTEAIQKALDEKGIILLTKTYLISYSLQMLSDTVVCGGGKLILTGGVVATEHCGYIFAENEKNISVKNITIENLCDEQGNDKTITFKNCIDVIVEHCTILNKGYRTGWTLVFWNVTNGLICKNNIYGSESYQLDDGIHVTGKNIRILENYVETIDDSIAVGYNSIESIGGIQPIDDVISEDIVIADNIINSTEAGMHLYTYNKETTIDNVVISNNIVNGRIIIRDDVSSVADVTITNVTVEGCHVDDSIHVASSSPIVLGNCDNVLFNSCAIKNTKGVGVVSGERDFEKVTLNGCTLIQANENNAAYKAVLNMASAANIQPIIIMQGCDIKTVSRTALGYFGELDILNCNIVSEGTSTDFSLQGLGEGGIKAIGNIIKTKSSCILSVGELKDKLFVFANNVTNIANPTFESGATDFHTSNNIII